jgi:hypothetical protein
MNNLPEPKKGESTQSFIDRFMDDEKMKDTYPQPVTRHAMAVSQAQAAGREKSKGVA